MTPTAAAPVHKFYRIDNIHRSKSGSGYVYGTLADDDTGAFVMAATIDYLIASILEHGYNVVNILDVERQLDRL